MSVQKAAFNIGGDHLQLGMAFSKVDQVNRLVHGFATMDNTDTSHEVVLSEASDKAFSRFRGNVREMHDKIAAGHVVSFTQQEYYDAQTEKFYNGIYVTAYVSLGAPLTWEKVLDGTLTGFSIGGNILESETQFVPELNKTVKYIKDYELAELSLVDNPANQLCNVFSITKSADNGVMMKGMIVDTKTENVFYCRKDELAKTSTEDKFTCPNCDGKMEPAGWFEYDDDNRSEKLKSVIQKHLAVSENTQDSPANNEGGVDVAVKEEVEVVEKAAEAVVEVTPVVEAVVEPVVVVAEPVEKAVEAKAADVSEVDDQDNELAKMFESLKTSISADLAKSAGSLAEVVTGLKTDLEGKYSELVVKHTELSEKFAALEARVIPVEKSLGVLESATAVRKSNDLGGSTEATIEKSVVSKWGGQFLGADTLV